MYKNRYGDMVPGHLPTPLERAEAKLAALESQMRQNEAALDDNLRVLRILNERYERHVVDLRVRIDIQREVIAKLKEDAAA